MSDLFDRLGINRVQPPTNSPPNFTPNKNQGKKMGPPGPPMTPGPPGFTGPTPKAIDPGSIYPCTNQFVYIWPTYGPGFWAFITYVGPRSLAGWRRVGRRWRYFGMDLRNIDSFYCA